MAFRDWFPFFAREGRATTTDLMRIGQVYPPGVRPIPQGVSNQEYGVSGTENFGGYIRREDFNPQLDDFQKAVQIYEQMRRTDAQIRAMLQVIKLPLRSATWTCNPATSDPVDKQIADFVNASLFDDDAMEESWDFYLRHILLQLDFGFSVMEKVWKVDTDGYYRLKRLAPRLPKTIREWHTDREGKLIAVVQYAPVPKSIQRAATGQQRTPTYNTTVSYQYLTIPSQYAAVFTTDREGDNYEGWSLLRTVYRNWWFKDQAYRTMGVGLDRWGVGIPVANLEEGHNLSVDELNTLREVLQAIRANERAYLVAPPHVKFEILGGEGSGTQGQFGIAWIDHNDSQISRNVLAGFLTMGRDQHGTLGFGTRLTDMFVSSLNGIAKGIAADLKRQVVKDLCDFNFDMTKRQYPDPVCLDLERVDMENLMNTLAKLTGTGSVGPDGTRSGGGVITPTDEDEALLRKMLGLPELDPKMGREAQQKQQEKKATTAALNPPPQPKSPAESMVEAVVAADAAKQALKDGAVAGEEEDATE